MIRYLLIVIMAVLFCSGCETIFLNPLSDPSRAKPDDRLYGRWVCTDKENKGIIIQFDKNSDTETKISVFAKDNHSKNPPFLMFPTKVGKHTFMNLMPTEEDKGKGYLIAKYQVSGDSLTIWIFDSEKIKAVVTQGKLKGTPGAGIGTTTISDTAEHVAAFLESPDGDNAFEYFGAFKKLNK